MSSSVTPTEAGYASDEVQSGSAATIPNYRWRTIRGAGKFLALRVAGLALAVITAVYLTILIANLGGYVDTIVAANIRQNVGFMMAGGWLQDLPEEERMARAEEQIAAMQEAAGLNEPLIVRSGRWLGNGLLLNWGEPERNANYGLASRTQTVRQIISDHLARTLLVFGVANVFMFVAALLFALVLNRRFGGVLDRIFILLSPLSSAPAWVFGILLSMILLQLFGFSPGGTLDTLPDSFGLSSVLVTLRHMLLPFIAIFLAGLFRTAFTWRSYFLSETNEAYVELGYAKGLSTGRVDRHYILRPALPALLTSFALLLAVLWQDIIALEYFFNVQGIGRLFVTALNAYDTSMLVAITTTFAYLLVATVLILDIVYVFVDPRVRVGTANDSGSAAPVKSEPFWKRWKKTPPPTTRVQTPSPAAPTPPAANLDLSGLGGWLDSLRVEISRGARELRRYPAAILGLVIIAFLFAVSIYTVIALPYGETTEQWRSVQGVWDRNPREALPAWVNLFARRDLPPTIAFSSAAGDGAVETSSVGESMTDVSYTFTFDYPYRSAPQDIVVDIEAVYKERGPHVTLTWVYPDGTEQELTSYQPNQNDAYFVSQDDRLQRRLGHEAPLHALFLGPDGQAAEPVPGTYALKVSALHFEPQSELDVDLTLIGQVHGLAGTDAKRRDLTIPLLWGTPVALAFGLTAALVTSVGGMIIAALAAWHGGWIDRGVQFLTEVNLILPFFPIALMIFVLYSRSIFTILGVTILLSLFGSSVKTYRAAFLQLRSSSYVEAARAYGASNWRIVSRYLMPRLITLLVPAMIILVPTYVFLEATLSYLGVSDPLLPTWGKLIASTLSLGVLTSSPHLVVAPFAMLFLTGFAFAMVGIALERILDPRLRES